MTARLSDVSKGLHSRLKKFFDAPLDAAATPLELCQAVIDDVERHVLPLGRGQRVFPYTRVTVQVLQRQADGPALDAAFATLDHKIRERLGELRCDAPRSLDARTTVLEEAPADWRPGQLFAVDYAKEAETITAPAPAALPVAPAAPPSLRIEVLRGAATASEYNFTEPLISIGRSADLTDDLGRVRRNRVAFLDTVDGVTETVGRAHARLRFDTTARAFCLFDDGSSNGTSIFRRGATIAVPPRDPRGIRVQTGDEVQVGRAVLRLTLEAI